MLVRALGLLFLFNRGDDAPGRTARPHDVFVGNGKQVSLINGEFATNLGFLSKSCTTFAVFTRERGYLGNFLRVCQFANPCKQSKTEANLHVRDHFFTVLQLVKGVYGRMVTRTYHRTAQLVHIALPGRFCYGALGSGIINSRAQDCHTSRAKDGHYSQ